MTPSEPQGAGRALAELPLKELLDQIASESPTPGGGSVCALSGALAGALAEMVCALTQGRKKYAAVAVEVAQRGLTVRRLRLALQGAIDADARAYGAVVAARKLPKETDQDKTARTAAIEAATWVAVAVPLQVCTVAVQLLEELVPIASKGNASAITDAGVAGQLALAAFEGAALNVEVNLCCLLPGPKVAAHRASVLALRAQAAQYSRDISAIVAQRM